jgi:hypothetical protein
MAVIIVPISSSFCKNCKTSPLSLGLGLGLGLGIPLLCIITIWLCCRYDKYRMNKLQHKFMLSFNKKYSRLCEIIPDEQMRTNVERCIFHPNVIEYVSNLKEEEQQYIYKYIKDKHHESKSQELITFVNIKKENNEMNNEAIIKIVC